MRNKYEDKSHRELLAENRRLIQQLSDVVRALDPHAHRELLADAQAVGMATWLRREAFPTTEPDLVFDMRMVDFVTFGEVGRLIESPNPGLAGLGFAWKVFSLGTMAGSAVDAAYFVGPVSCPGRAFRNRLNDAADFVEAHCPALARCMRTPRIRVTDAGVITHNAHLGPRIRLSAP